MHFYFLPPNKLLQKEKKYNVCSDQAGSKLTFEKEKKHILLPLGKSGRLCIIIV